LIGQPPPQPSKKGGPDGAPLTVQAVLGVPGLSLKLTGSKI
jgi:hypothetical protein